VSDKLVQRHARSGRLPGPPGAQILGRVSRMPLRRPANDNAPPLALRLAGVAAGLVAASALVMVFWAGF